MGYLEYIRSWEAWSKVTAAWKLLVWFLAAFVYPILVVPVYWPFFMLWMMLVGSFYCCYLVFLTSLET